MNLSAFKAYDVRGGYPEQVNEELAYKTGRALVRFLSAKNIVVGMDMRSSSPSLKKSIIEGISCEGADVFDVGLCTTPMLSFAVKSYGYNGGIMVSASHSPGNENGFKLIDANGVQMGEDFGLLDIKGIVSKGFGACSAKGAVVEKDILADYMKKMLKPAQEIDELKVVIDYSSGVGSVSGKPLFARLSNITSFEINDTPDGSFPSHPANPHDIKNFAELQEKVLEVGADIGLFFDGDADRVQAVDEMGKIVPMDLLFCLLAEEELKIEANKNKEYYYDLRFSKVVPEIITRMGGVPIMMRVGNPFYKKALAESGVLAAEFSGHVMYAENANIDDGLFCSIKILQMLSQKKETLSGAITKINKYHTSCEVSLEAKTPKNVFELVRAEFPGAKEAEIDGLYLDLSDGFISVRQSQTEPQYFRVRVEGKTKQDMERRLETVLNIIKS